MRVSRAQSVQETSRAKLWLSRGPASAQARHVAAEEKAYQPLRAAEPHALICPHHSVGMPKVSSPACRSVQQESDHALSMQDLDSFRKEIALMSRVAHPNVVSLVAARVLPPGEPLFRVVQHNCSRRTMSYVLCFGNSLQTMATASATSAKGDTDHSQ